MFKISVKNTYIVVQIHLSLNIVMKNPQNLILKMKMKIMIMILHINIKSLKEKVYSRLRKGIDLINSLLQIIIMNIKID